MTTEYLIVLRVLVDDDRPWWEAMGLPDPARWALSETFGGAVFPAIASEDAVDRGVRAR